MGSMYPFSVKIFFFPFLLPPETRSGFFLSKTLSFHSVLAFFFSSALESVVGAAEETSVTASTMELADPAGRSFGR